jgi:hypothetical protein
LQQIQQIVLQHVFANSPNPYFDVILRNSVLKTTQIEQAFSQAPTFLTLWIGNNDVLGYATSGGTSPSAPTDPMHSIWAIVWWHSQGLVQYATQTNAKVVVANIPSVTAIPFFTTVGPLVAINPAVQMVANKQLLKLQVVYLSLG